jgi:RNA polymerase sigma-70 factor (ECF subfamily)
MFERYYREILGFLSGKVADRAMAADLTQESYARAYAAQGSGDGVNNPRAMLYRIARNLVIDHHRHAEVRTEVEMPACEQAVATAPAPRSLEPEVATASRQGVLALAQAIDNLPPRCREAFMLNRFDGLSYAEVAGRMGISVKMVEQHISNALDACARCRDGDAAAPRRKLKRSRQN